MAKKGNKMTAEKYLCPTCKQRVELSTKPKRSFMGFLRIPCLVCQKEFQYPLTRGYVIFYWIVLSGNVASAAFILSQDRMVALNPIGVIILIVAIRSLRKNSAMKRQIAELQKTGSKQW